MAGKAKSALLQGKLKVAEFPDDNEIMDGNEKQDYSEEPNKEIESLLDSANDTKIDYLKHLREEEEDSTSEIPEEYEKTEDSEEEEDSIGSTGLDLGSFMEQYQHQESEGEFFKEEDYGAKEQETRVEEKEEKEERNSNKFISRRRGRPKVNEEEEKLEEEKEIREEIKVKESDDKESSNTSISFDILLKALALNLIETARKEDIKINGLTNKEIQPIWDYIKNKIS